MADPIDLTVPTDSRQAGFNPEVEESHAAELARLEAEAAARAAAASSSPPPPSYTHRCGGCGGQFEQLAQPCPHCGASGTMQALKPPAEP